VSAEALGGQAAATKQHTRHVSKQHVRCMVAGGGGSNSSSSSSRMAEVQSEGACGGGKALHDKTWPGFNDSLLRAWSRAGLAEVGVKEKVVRRGGRARASRGGAGVRSRQVLVVWHGAGAGYERQQLGIARAGLLRDLQPRPGPFVCRASTRALPGTARALAGQAGGR